jgi:hypothetical protein
MAAQTLEDRVAALEKEITRLKAKVEGAGSGTPWWEKIAGTFENDPIYEEAMKLGREYRQSTTRLQEAEKEVASCSFLTRITSAWLNVEGMQAIGCITPR